MCQMGTERMRALFVAFLAFIAAFPALAQDRVYEEGQVWAFDVENSGDDNALIIQRIEPAEDTGFPYDVYHISMFVDIPLGEMDELVVGHLPVSRETLDASVTETSERDMSTFSDWEEGYREWQNAKGGVFTIPMDEIVAFLVELMTQQVIQPKHGSTH